MSLIGTHLTILAGPGVPLPLPETALRAMASLEVTHATDGRSGLQAQFRAGRGASIAEALEYPLMRLPGLKAGARIVVMLTVGIVPDVLFDGFITQSQLTPGTGQGDGTLAITAEDLGVKLDQVDRTEAYPGLPVAAIAALVMARYAQYGLVPLVIPPIVTEVPLPMDRPTTQGESDLEFLKKLATDLDYIFTITPGPLPLTSTGYFGPAIGLGLPQPALTINMGPDTNVTAINFQFNAADAGSVTGSVQDRQTNREVPVRSTVPLRVPLATAPAVLNQGLAAQRRYRPGGARTAATAMAEAQAASDRASSEVLTAEGTLDGARYGSILKPRKLVGLRGAGLDHDGLYMVREVKHQLARGSYTQAFKLAREGLGSTVPLVRP